MLYHKSIGFPDDITFFCGIFELIYTKHAIRASENDRYGNINLPTFLDTEKADLVEIEVNDGIMVKGVYRTYYDNKYDLIIVMTHDRKVKTVWLNDRTDKHSTLDKSKYTKLK